MAQAYKKRVYVDYEALSRTFNFVMLGDMACGKTSLAIAANEGAYPLYHRGKNVYKLSIIRRPMHKAHHHNQYQPGTAHL